MLSFSTITNILLSFLIRKFLYLYFLEFSGDEVVIYGVSDRVEEGKWVCEGTGQTIATASAAGTGGPLFYRTQPDNVSGDEDCAVGKSTSDFLLRDTPCKRVGYYLCEKP